MSVIHLCQGGVGQCMPNNLINYAPYPHKWLDFDTVAYILFFKIIFFRIDFTHLQPKYEYAIDYFIVYSNLWMFSLLKPSAELFFSPVFMNKFKYQKCKLQYVKPPASCQVAKSNLCQNSMQRIFINIKQFMGKASCALVWLPDITFTFSHI